MRNLLVVTAMVLTAGCASPSVVPMGSDTYMIAKDGSFTTFGGAAVKGELYQQAYSFCQSKGKDMKPLKDASRDSGYGRYANAEVQFKCLNPGDSALDNSGGVSEPSIKIRTE